MSNLLPRCAERFQCLGCVGGDGQPLKFQALKVPVGLGQTVQYSAKKVPEIVEISCEKGGKGRMEVFPVVIWTWGIASGKLT